MMGPQNEMMKSGERDRGRVKGIMCYLNTSSFAVTLPLFVYIITVILIPLVSPYGIGIHAGQIAPAVHRQQTSKIVSKLNVLPSAADKIKSSSVLNLSKVEVETDNTKDNRLKRFWRHRRRKEKTLNRHGEYQANLLSRLFYGYVTPLVQLASARHLQSSDVFEMPITKKMDTTVPDLQKIYDRCRLKARRHQEVLRSGEGENMYGDNTFIKRRINERIAASQTLVLAKALVLHQKRTLILTGCLRLINTGIQAFPALLVARLLRLIESGESYDIIVPIQASLSLVGVLLVKMIMENQYFHNIVKGATQVRGGLSGLIFDKTLKVSSGGSSSSNAVEQKEAVEDEKDANYKKDTSELGAGKVINLMQSDTSIIELAAVQVHTLWDGILQIVVYSTLLYRLLGPSVVWGFCILLLQIPLNSVGLRVLNRLSKKQNEAKDARTSSTTEAISNMKLLKLQAWDNIFEDEIKKHRKEELQRHINRGTFRALNSAISNAIPAIILVVTLGAYARSGGPIVASTIFTAISLFNQLRFPLFFYPLLIDALANGKQSLRRISSYLCQEELSDYVQNYPATVEGGGRIEMRNGNFLWPSAKFSSGSKAEVSPASPSPALRGAELTVNPGEVVAVVGSVGSGKTALVKALLGELEPAPKIVVDSTLNSPQESNVQNQSNDGLTTMDVPVVSTNGGVAYCAQEAWLPKGTIREAILFGRKYDEERYLSAIYDAGLDDDIVDDVAGSTPKQGLLTHDTEVGEGGSSLSGGQRARVQLARALYDQAKIYVLDDPLSALDAAVGATVFERMTLSLRRRNAAVIFVTNDPSLPKRCDRVILLGKVKSSSGSQSCSHIVDTGTNEELISRGHNLQSISVHDATPAPFRPVDHDNISSCHADPDQHDRGVIENNAGYVSKRSTSTAPMMDEDGTEAKSFVSVEKKSTADVTSKPVTSKIETMDDLMTTGAVPLSVYIKYFKAIRKPQLVALALACIVMVNGAQFFQQYVVAKWAGLGQGNALSTSLGGGHLRKLAYAAITVSISLFLRGYTLMHAGTRASEFYHSRMLSTVMRAPVSFFDTTPSGQFLSRFGKEMETIDRSIPDSIVSVLYCFLQIFMTVIGLAGVITPKILVALVPIGLFYSATMARFRPASRDLKRCESKSRSPIYTHFGEALRGTETIRSFKSTTTWSAKNRQLTNENLSVFYTLKNLDRWLSIRLESLGNLVVLSAALSSVIMTRSGKLSAGGAGWGLTQTLLITGLLAWAVEKLTDLESQMMSVMRVSELINPEPIQSKGLLSSDVNIQMVPSEMSEPGDGFGVLSTLTDSKIPSAPDCDNDLLQSGWPWKGGISFKNVSMRYNSESALVLKDVTIPIPPGSTLGVVGRTGSGKSSLLLTLFRISEIEKGGSIEIDGVDIRSISLKTLRRSISIIPQDPVLFSGTLMYNLDATGKAGLDDAWEAMDAASPALAKQFRDSGLGLNFIITEGGKNLSSGQRQLICLARALLRKSKILVLDEATSSVDSNTDAVVQATIRREFVNKGVSVITVAHRLDTVLGSDKIAVLGAGELIEYGTPSELLRIPNGSLRRLVDADRGIKTEGEKNRDKERANLSESNRNEILA